MEFAIAKISTKGQIVIPSPLREGIGTGDEFLIVKDNGRLIMKNMKELTKSLKSDLIFAERVENSWRQHDKGKFESKSSKDFLKELRAC